MPNHFTVIALCGRNYELETDERRLEDRLDELCKTNLCEKVMPLPSELRNIVASGGYGSRYRHKVTGEIYESNNPPEIEGVRGDYAQEEVSEFEAHELIKKYGSTNWHGWCNDKWGTKWGTYDMTATILPGDGSPLLLSFLCAWGPPNPECMSLIDDWLCEEYHLQNIKWIGFDPCDGTTTDIHLG